MLSSIIRILVLIVFITGIQSYRFLPITTQIHRNKLFSITETVDTDFQVGTSVDDVGGIVPYEAFLKQISELSSKTYLQSIENDNGEIISQTIPSHYEIPVDRNIIQNPTALRSGMPIEFIYKSRISFGNFLSEKNNSKSLVVQLPTGEIKVIDVGQVISCWDLLADESIPTSRQDWGIVVADAFEILGQMSPRKSDLEEFWKLLLQRSKDIVVDSLDLGIYIFQERSFKSWINPYADAVDSSAIALTAAQRYAAALVLYNDDFHFKRRLSFTPSIVSESKQEEGEGESHSSDIEIIEGGYRVLDESVVSFRESDVFAKYYNEIMSEQNENTDESTEGKKQPFRAGCITRQVRLLETYALSPPKMLPSPVVKMILKKLQKSVDPKGAIEVIRALQSKSHLFKPSHGRDEGISTAVGSTRSTMIPITPWSRDALEASEKLRSDVELRRAELREPYFGRAGKRGPTGRMDFRSSNVLHPVICIDSKRATFLDDAFSFSPETGEILVHVADVVGVLRKYDVLQEVAKERLSSIFSPSGPLHMLPPQALDSLKLSSSSPNEVITVALSIDFQSGEIKDFRVFPSVIGPVFAIDIESADELLAGVGLGISDTSDDISSTLSDISNNRGKVVAKRFGYPEALIKDLLSIRDVMSLCIAKQPWIDSHFSQGTSREFSLNKKTGVYNQRLVEKTTGNRLVNSLLSLYSNSTVSFCRDRDVAVPVAWDNRDRLDSTFIRRFASQPLRNWLSQLQQKQVRAALRMELPLSKKDCAMAVSYHNSRKKQASTMETKRRDIMSFESFQSHCSSLFSSGQEELVFDAQGLGIGGTVKIDEFKVTGLVNVNIERGEKCRVLVKKIIPETMTVLLEVVKL